MNARVQRLVEEYDLDLSTMSRDAKMRLAQEALREYITDFETAIDAIGQLRLANAAEALGMSVEDIETSWCHECEDESNPTGQCVYNGFEDPVWDDCLFCHQPFERK